MRTRRVIGGGRLTLFREVEEPEQEYKEETDHRETRRVEQNPNEYTDSRSEIEQRSFNSLVSGQRKR